MNNKFINYITFLIESKNDEKQITKLKLNIILYITFFAFLVFFISFFAYWINTSKLMDVKNERDQFLSEMMRANMGEVPKRPSIVREAMAKEINEITKGSNADSLENKILNYIAPFLESENNSVNEITKKLRDDLNFNFTDFFEKEKGRLNVEIQKINDSIIKYEKAKLNLKEVIENLDYYKLSFKFDESLKINKVFKINDSLMVEFKEPNKYTIKNLEFTKDELEIYINNPNIEYVPNDLNAKNVFLKFILEGKDIYEKKIEEMTLLEKNILDLNISKQAKYKNQVSLETYRKNKAYIIKNQYDMTNQSLEYCLKKGIKYFAFYQSLIIVILVFTALMALCVFVISSKGWSGSDPIVKLIAITVIVVLGMANLINVVMNPKANYISYIKKAEKNEAVQADIIQFFNRYDKLEEKEIDELINKNFLNITKFSEILPETNEAGLQEGFKGFSELKMN